MKITIACVGKIKEKYLTAGIEEFSKRLTPFCKLETLAINEERMPDNPSPAEKQQVLERETQRLLAIIPANSYVILLDVIGKQLSKAVFTSGIICGVVFLLGYFGCTVICVSAAALSAYIPLAIVLLLLWFLIGWAL